MEDEPSDSASNEDAAGIDAMYRIAMLLAQHLNLQEMYQTIVHLGCELTQTHHGFLYVVNDKLEKLELKYGVGVYRHYQGVDRKKDEPSVSSTVWKTGRPLLIENIAQWHARATDRPYGWDTVHSVLGIPLQLDYGVIAVIGLGFSTKSRVLTDNEADLLGRFAALAAVSLQNAMVHSGLHAALLEKKAIPNLPNLTDREKAVLVRMANGLSNREIAKDMGIEVCTVKTHAHHLFDKLAVRNRAEAVVKAWEYRVNDM
ncbi:LuxR C-terminal-related transcriptional regulator [Sporomusa sp.]|uniref:LuxR C-terminal-related transcriptional regulator n=1 Tax=Sporomusa sp. TaxID=2078658 RepID=UPI002CD5E536|nr:LuxR C-terminal-related transcriptional regulator [Sporomusa sp.]HWR07235.1 LuxR C-terminal-related transcriptional regulator [Sporomusa sp.]